MEFERFNHCPGNMTRYDLLFAKNGNGGFILVWLNRSGISGPAINYDGGGMVTPGYLEAKLDHPEGLRGDMNALCAFLASKGVHAEVTGGFKADGPYRR